MHTLSDTNACFLIMHFLRTEKFPSIVPMLLFRNANSAKAQRNEQKCSFIPALLTLKLPQVETQELMAKDEMLELEPLVEIIFLLWLFVASGLLQLLCIADFTICFAHPVLLPLNRRESFQKQKENSRPGFECLLPGTMSGFSNESQVFWSNLVNDVILFRAGPANLVPWARFLVMPPFCNFLYLTANLHVCKVFSFKDNINSLYTKIKIQIIK